MSAHPPWDIRRSVRRHLVLSLAAAALLTVGLGGWAATTELAGAVVAPGALMVDSFVKKVQHPTGGVVGELRVRDGDLVHAGQVVMRMDETVTRANLAAVDKNLVELTARQGRLEAERDGAQRIAFSASLRSRVQVDPEAGKVMAGETRLFELRLDARAGQKAQLKERTGQLREEIQGLTGQMTGKRREIELINRELEGVRDLWRKNLIPIQRVTSLERDAARLEGEYGQLVASVAQTKGKISETELQVIQVDQDLRSEVAKELSEVQGKIAELVEKRVAAEDQLKRVDVRAPQDGMVHQLAVHTIGGVVGPGEPIMLIVPRGDTLVIEAKVAPKDIDQVQLGQRAMLRLTAFNQRTTPEVGGEVSLVAADQITDEKTGTSYFKVHVTPKPEELARLKGIKLVPGMPAEIFIHTGERSVLSYLVKPLNDQIMHAFRED
ncbi:MULTISPECIES: HlyD family type I secretion periplasmic adaptor subunit [Methylobacterium]|uniref:Membrane fusion protein (MFP) family protein n=1 Tax=Methylobacterium brachiatum TaxID=269660 RepID=A0AAJ1U2M5_9HYPH|nr:MULTISPECIES: HlyD family type I secretion periplasmic adaptor subunit [Methylobacterium]EIZ84290.1 HlyD family type I secretion membrane fusion protein [Methylobacterium sp. GXF4]MBP28049.1 HlyD family type I secretion periplasmic adaptor subunit [Methylobacterium sp.]MBP32532.1 HlyD family type I secretion periplasmic adaptor subunit [Methylobacterium sp.]MDH2312570.1 HlyD family type I secretion periplasmic adaptor subunit [Methylobacterium brachiatum]MDQ0546843.1 HlyD family secretion p